MEIRRLGNKVIPTVDFRDLEDVKRDKKTLEEIRKRGVVTVKGVLGTEEALELKAQAVKYIENNRRRVKGSYFIS